MEIKTNRIIVAGNLDRPKWHRLMKVVLDTRGICTTINTVGGGNLEPKILVPNILRVGNYSPSNHNASTIVDVNGIAPTTMENHGTVTAVLEPKIMEEYKGVGVHPTSKKLEFDDWRDKECPTILATDYKAPKTVAYSNYRVRKLTPRECYRLMGFDDEDFDKAQSAGISNSQLYKQAGNSIVVNVLEAIFKEME